MPGLMAVIGANAEPMRRELLAVQNMARQAGVNIRSGIEGGSHAKAGVITETVVLLRELSRGNYSRVPGSLTILLQRMGVLRLLMGDTASAANILSDAWQKQSEIAAIAAVAATRKAAASSAAFYADEAETEATLAQAVADEEGAAAAIINAKATQAKAVAAGEAAASIQVGAVAAVGSIGVVASVLIGLAAGAYAAYKLTGFLVDKLSGLKPVDFHPAYIARHLKAVNQAAEGQKEINREILKTIELYNSAAKAAERIAKITEGHFDHLLKMNELEKDPAKKAAGELQIKQQKRQAELQQKYIEKANLEIESTAKQSQADAVKVSSKESDANLLAVRKKEAEEAQKYLDDVEKAGGPGKGEALYRAYNAAALSGVSGNDLDAAEKSNAIEAHRRIKAYQDTVDSVADNDEKRKTKSDLTKQAEVAAAAAAGIGLMIPSIIQANNQQNKDDADLEAERLKAGQKTAHGSVSSLQQVGGGYLRGTALESLAAKQLVELKKINTNTGRGGGVNF